MDTHTSPWLVVSEAAKRARVGPKVIYREVRAGRLRAARVGGRRELRFRAEWIDEWLLAESEPRQVEPSLGRVLDYGRSGRPS